MADLSWSAAFAPAAQPVLGTFAGLDVWTSSTTFERWTGSAPDSLEFDCRKGSGLVTGGAGDLSCAEVEIAKRFRAAGWHAGWVATCGRRNDLWREVMVGVTTPAHSVLPVAPTLLPARIASKLVRHGRSGYPDVVAWQAERNPVFVELKGPRDSGIAQAKWLEAALSAGTIELVDFVLVSWTFI